MSIKRRLLSTLSIMSLVAASLPIYTYAQETSEANQTEVETPDKGLSFTYEEAAKRVDEDFYDQYLSSLHYYGITDEMLATLPEGTVREAAIQYLMELPTGGDISMPYAHFKKLYPTFVSITQTSSEQKEPNSTDKGLSYTYEEAAQKVDQGFYDEYLYSLHYYGVTDEMLAKLPKGAVREAAIQYLIKLPTGGDITMPYNNFKKLYPEIFSQSDSKPNNQSQTESDNKKEDSIKHEKLTQHLNEQRVDSEAEKEALPLNYTFVSETGEYTIKYVSLLAPASAGNQDQELPMLVVKYEFENTSDHKVMDYAHTWDQQVFFSQSQQDSTIKLEPGKYQLDPNQEVFPKYEEVDSGEKTRVTAYYQLMDSESPLNISILENETIADFDLNIEDLLNLPNQSSLYLNDSNQGYLFDFDTIYLLNPSQNLADQLEFEIQNFSDFELSEEAKLQMAKITESQTNVIKLENINYCVTEEEQIEVINEDEEVLLTLQSQSNWETFKDLNDQMYQIVQ
ncbi:DUF5067 domain-containing protein [Facklamia sp. P13064]|uniref:DUF5067 domain-containing protein n=1 Tax=unclassified Facklamia TaxID=2622293 RepID=UPI003D16D2B3